MYPGAQCVDSRIRESESENHLLQAQVALPRAGMQAKGVSRNILLVTQLKREKKASQSWKQGKVTGEEFRGTV